MHNLRKLSRIDITLLIILVLGAVIALSFSQTNADAQQEKANLETRLRAAQLNLSEVEKMVDLESLRQSLEEAHSASDKNWLPSKTEAMGVSNQILRNAEINNVTIAKWDYNYSSVGLRTGRYVILRHSLSADGKSDDLIKFITALTSGTVALVVQDIDISKIGGEEEALWQMQLQLLVYYGES